MHMHPYPEKLQQIGAQANNTFTLLGIEPVSFGNGEAVLRMTVTDRVHNGAGVMQGGFYTILGDEAIALAIHAELDANENAVTISETTEFFKGIAAGPVVAQAKITKNGRRVIFAEAYVRETDVNGKILSKTTASYLVV